MIDALHLPTHRNNLSKVGYYATDDDFQQLFATEITEFLRLALQLTADAGKAERCLILAIRDCFGSSNISRNFAQVWARRMVIRNAIGLVWGIDNDVVCETEVEFHLQPREYQIEAVQGSIGVLDLADFERMVFVICVLERLSILDCALLLRRSPKDVNDAIVRVTNRVSSGEDQKRPTTTAIRVCGGEDS